MVAYVYKPSIWQGGVRRIRSSKSSSATQRPKGQPGLPETLSYKPKQKKTKRKRTWASTCILGLSPTNTRDRPGQQYLGYQADVNRGINGKQATVQENIPMLRAALCINSQRYWGLQPCSYSSPCSGWCICS